MDRLKRTLTLRGWFRLMAVSLVLVFLLMEARLVQMEWRQLQRAEEGQQAVARLRLALVAMEMVSRERGPANGVLGDETPSGSPRLREALAIARSRTDQALANFRQVWQHEAGQARYQRVQREADALLEGLRLARAAVDRQAALPLAQRQPDAIRDSVRGMVDLVPLLASAITVLTDDAQLADPTLGSSVWAARLSAELREYAGQLGSLFTPALTRQQRFTPDELAAVERVKGRIEQLRHLLDLRVGQFDAGDAVQVALAVMERDYFDKATRLVDKVLASGRDAAPVAMTPAEFAAAYVPDMNAILALRDALLDSAERHCARAQASSRQWLAGVLVTTSLLMGLILLLLRVAHQRFVQPLSQAAEVLHAMSAGDLSRELPKAVAGDEFAEVFGGINALKQQSEARAALELERDKLIVSLREQSTTDFLTGLPNRRAFFEAAEAELARARRHGFQLVLMLLDVDFFKKINDTAGHAAGDQALKAVAHTLKHSRRQGDLVARLGGEEFVVLLTHCEPDDGWRFAERLREALASQEIALGEGQPPLHLTVSVGLAASGTHGLALDTLLARADDAMYKAKHAGRNRTEMAVSDAA
ncbi:diguanylate cyclase [Aquabacterium sp. NJ1]|uniref:diguanylate cyclase n=1 Tax=Aquabacterium sp. NJ1 TaxID=1538295 RepID=UPI000691907D|nr:diguanylate cyclase [Aquabacterium sp. NJ1]